MAKSTGSADSVQIGFRHFGKVEIDDDVDGLNVDTASEQVRTDQITTKTGTEIVKYTVSVSLGHFGMNVITAVTQFSNFLSQKLHTLGGIAKDDALVYLEKKIKNASY